MKIFYIVLCILGLVLPYWQFLPWLMEHGIDIILLIQEAGQLNIGAFAWLDVLVSAIVLIGFILYEGSKLKMRGLWIPIVGTCVVGVSFGLPLFLLLREMHLAKLPSSAISSFQ
jgi:hypothetical protein